MNRTQGTTLCRRCNQPNAAWEYVTHTGTTSPYCTTCRAGYTRNKTDGLTKYERRRAEQALREHNKG